MYAKDSEIENLEVNILIQNFKKKTKRRKKFRTKINTGKLEKREGGKVEQGTAVPVVRGTVAH